MIEGRFYCGVRDLDKERERKRERQKRCVPCSHPSRVKFNRSSLVSLFASAISQDENLQKLAHATLTFDRERAFAAMAHRCCCCDVLNLSLLSSRNSPFPFSGYAFRDNSRDYRYKSRGHLFLTTSVVNTACNP